MVEYATIPVGFHDCLAYIYNRATTFLSNAVFFRYDISVILPKMIWKLAITVVTNLYFRSVWPNCPNFFRSLKKNPVYVRKQTPRSKGKHYLQEAGQQKQIHSVRTNR